MTHSITAFERKHLAPKDRRVQPVEIKFSMPDLSPALFVLAMILVLDAGAFLMWTFSGQHPVDGFYAGALTAKLVSLF